MVPAGERSQLIQSLMQQALAEHQKRLEAIAEECDTRPDFSIVRGDAAAFEPSPTGSTNKFGDRAPRNLSA